MYVLQYTLGTSFVHITWIIHKKLFMRRNKDGKYFMQKWHKNPLFGSILFSNPLQPYLRPNIVQMTIIISHSTVHCWLRCPIRILKLKKSPEVSSEHQSYFQIERRQCCLRSFLLGWSFTGIVAFPQTDGQPRHPVCLF